MTRSDDERSSGRHANCAAEEPQVVPVRDALGNGGARCQLKRWGCHAALSYSVCEFSDRDVIMAVST